MVGAVLTTVVMVVVLAVVMLAMVVSGRVVGAMLRDSSSGAAERHDKGHSEDCTDAGNKLHLCLLTHECCTRLRPQGRSCVRGVRAALPWGSIRH